MSLLSASRSASRYLLAKPGACSVFFQRSMSLDGLKGFPDAESARENVYFKQEEEVALRKLLSKIKKQTDESKSAAELSANKAKELAPIQGIITKYKIAEADVEALLDWKHHHH